MGLIEQYQNLINDLDEIILLGNDGLLKSEEMYQVIYCVEDKMKEISSQLDKRSQLAVEKNIPMWRNDIKTGIYVDSQEVLKKVSPLKALLSELLSKQTNLQPIQTKPEIVIIAGKPYDGRLYLRNILQQASEKISIRDSYFKPIVLDILLEYLLDNNNLKIEILTGNNNRLPSLRSSYQVFKTQYSEFDLQIKYSSQENDHPRYIIIDNQLLFNPDHSLDQWGEKTVNIHQLRDNIQIENVKNKLTSEWNSALPI